MFPELKSALDGIKTTVEGFGSRQTEMQRQLDSVDLRGATRHVADSGTVDLLRKGFEDSAEFARLIELGKGKATIKLDTKTLISSVAVGSGTAGILVPERVGGIVPLAQRRLFLRDLLSRGNRVTSNAAYFIREQTFVNGASPRGAEGTAKTESEDTFSTVSRPVVTLSHWIPGSRQVLDDMPALLNFIRTKLLFGLRYKEDLELLSGDGSVYHLDGLLNSAQAFNTALLGASAGWNKIDILRRALQQVERADEIPAGFFCLHPDDWADIELTKTSQGAYLVGEPGGQDIGPDSLWAKPVVVTTAIPAGQFLCGSSQGAELFDRMDATLEISTEYADYFVRNLIAILCECREVLCIYRPNSFVRGSLSSSPA